MRFKRPSKEERLRAARLSREEKQESIPASFRPIPEGSFKPIDIPKGSDWLCEHKESGQSLTSFTRVSFKAQPHGNYRVIELIPIGPIPSLEEIRTYCEAFFAGCKVRIEKGIDLEDVMEGARSGDEDQLQLLTGTVYNILGGMKPKRDTLVRIAVTMADLYPGDDWNFVFGEARAMDGVGVFSFSRYMESFLIPFEGKVSRDDLCKDETGSEPTKTVLYRACKVLTHETGHLFGIKHCTFYECLMCGCNHLDEFDKRPLHLCPIDLRKLQIACKFDVVERYRLLAEISKKFGWSEHVKFIEQRLELLAKMASDGLGGKVHKVIPDIKKSRKKDARKSVSPSGRRKLGARGQGMVGLQRQRKRSTRVGKS